MARVICAGHVNWDVTFCVDRLPRADGEATIVDQFQSSGGSAANVAATLATLGVESTLLGSVGTDEHGQLARWALADAGVDCRPLVAVDGATTVKYLLVDDDGSVVVLGNAGVNESFQADDLPTSSLAAAEVLHLTSQDPATAKSLVDRARDHDVVVTFDPGRRVGDRAFDDVLAHADLVFLNEREAAAVYDGDLRPSDDRDHVVVVKHGSGGAELFAPGGDHVRHDGFEIKPSDSTGAGDAFAAGFLAAWLDADPGTIDRCAADVYEHSLAVGNACGALAASERGTRPSLSWEAIETYTRES